MTDPDVKSTPLAAKHVELGARMVPFAGWNMPVQYTGIPGRTQSRARSLRHL